MGSELSIDPQPGPKGRRERHLRLARRTYLVIPPATARGFAIAVVISCLLWTAIIYGLWRWLG